MSLCHAKLELMEASHSDLVLGCELPPDHSGSHRGVVFWPQHWENNGKAYTARHARGELS